MAPQRQLALLVTLIAVIPSLNGAFSSSLGHIPSHNAYNVNEIQQVHRNVNLNHSNLRQHHYRRRLSSMGASMSNMLTLDSLSSSQWMPLYLSCLAGASTCLGAAIVFCRPSQKSIGPNTMSFSLALAASVMITVSILSILPECLRDTSLGENDSYQIMPIMSAVFLQRLVSFGLGCLLYKLLSQFAFPEPQELVVEALHNADEQNYSENEQDVTELKVTSSSHQHSSTPPTKQRQEQSMRSRKSSQLSSTKSSSFDNDNSSADEEKAEGAILTKPLLQSQDTSNDNNYAKSPVSQHATSFSDWSTGNDLATPQQRRAWRVTLLLFCSLLLHNFPEGLAVAASSVQSTKLGLAVTFGIFGTSFACDSVFGYSLACFIDSTVVFALHSFTTISLYYT